jgi:hypothetical protein
MRRGWRETALKPDVSPVPHVVPATFGSRLRKALGSAFLLMLLAVALFLLANAWSDYANGAATLGATVKLTLIVLGAPLLVSFQFFLGEALMRSGIWLLGKLGIASRRH